MTQHKSIYIAGPMRGIPAWNLPAFFRAEVALRNLGWTVFNPARHDVAEGLDPYDYPNLPDGFTLEKALTWDFAKIIESKNICLLDGWWTSEGVAKELRVAEDVGAGVWRYYEVGEAVDTDTASRVFVRSAARLCLRSYAFVETVRRLKTPRSQAPASSGGLADADFHDTGDIINPVVGLLPSGANGEIRVIDPTTGAAKGQKAQRTDLLPQDALLELANHYGRGATKYADRNWEGGYAYSLSYAALLRHLLHWWNGDELDEEGFPHITAAAWHGLALLTFALRQIGTDDRPTKGADDNGK